MMNKVAIFGNTNNNNYVIARYLVDNGFRVTMYLAEYERSLFHPYMDTYEADDSIKLEYLEWGSIHDFSSSITDIELDSDCLIIASGSFMAYLNKLGIKVNIFVVVGGDLHEYPFFWRLVSLTKLLSVVKRWKKTNVKNNESEIQSFGVSLPKHLNLFRVIRNLWRFSKHQFLAIRKAEIVLLDVSNAMWESSLRKIRTINQDRILASPPMIYLNEYDSDRLPERLVQSQYYDESIYAIIKESNFVIFQHCRQLWTEKNKYCKGNDKLIRGFADYIQSGQKAILVLLEYGEDVDASRALINELNIVERVVWLPVMPRKDLMCWLNLSDVVVGELEYTVTPTYGVIQEALALSKNLIMHFDLSILGMSKEDLFPAFHASTAQDVMTGLNYFYQSKGQVNQIGHQWYKNNLLDDVVTEITNALRR